jgi:hypothetical protein
MIHEIKEITFLHTNAMCKLLKIKKYIEEDDLDCSFNKMGLYFNISGIFVFKLNTKKDHSLLIPKHLIQRDMIIKVPIYLREDIGSFVGKKATNLKRLLVEINEYSSQYNLPEVKTLNYVGCDL